MTIVIPVPAIPTAPPPPPYTDADAIADVEKAYPEAHYGQATGECGVLNWGEWGIGSTPIPPALEDIGPDGVLSFSAHSIGNGGFVQYYGCY